jgi:hypothetical protein
LVFSTPNTGIVSRHVEIKHPEISKQFSDCKNSEDNWNRLDQKVMKLEAEVLERIQKRRRLSEKMFSKMNDGLGNEVRGNLLLLMWASANGIPRLSLNCPLFDAYLKSLGATVPSSRHSLQDQYLPALDVLVVADMSDRLKKASCVSLSADGWRDRVRRDWIDIGVYWIEDGPSSWRICVLHPDLIPITTSTTSEAIHSLIAETTENYVRTLPFTFSTLTSISYRRIASKQQ